MAHGGYRGDELVAGVSEIGALIEQALEAAGVFGAEAREVIVAKLVDHDGQHQLGLRLGLRLRLGVRRG